MELLPEVYLRSRVCIFDQFCKIYNNFISKYIGAYPFSVVTIDGI